jgi:adenylosuccinate lyase
VRSVLLIYEYEMKAHRNDIDYDLAEKEAEFRHDMMAHVHTFGTACPSAMPIIHVRLLQTHHLVLA